MYVKKKLLEEIFEDMLQYLDLENELLEKWLYQWKVDYICTENEMTKMDIFIFLEVDLFKDVFYLWYNESH